MPRASSNSPRWTSSRPIRVAPSPADHGAPTDHSPHPGRRPPLRRVRGGRRYLHEDTERRATLRRLRLTMARRPNILLILVDDLRFDEFGAGGHPYMKTPHADRIARE